MKSDVPLAVLPEGLQAHGQGEGAAGIPHWRQNWDELHLTGEKLGFKVGQHPRIRCTGNKQGVQEQPGDNHTAAVPSRGFQQLWNSAVAETAKNKEHAK